MQVLPRSSGCCGIGAGCGLALAAVLSLLPCLQAQAADVTITASFSPSITQPGHHTFTNTTPNSGICLSNPEVCARESGVALGIEVDYGPFVKGAASRQQALFSVPDRPRAVQLTHLESGHTVTAYWSVGMLAGMYVLPRSVRQIVPTSTGNADGHGKLWGNSWVNAPAGCGNSTYGAFSTNYYKWAWRYPGSGNTCIKSTQYDFESMRMEDISIAYSMVSPNPLAMKNGTYRGQLELNIGPGQDFDFGDNATVADSKLTIHFELEVTHYFAVSFPANSSMVLLEPEGGWMQWTDFNQRPARLLHDMPFNVTSSAEFSVHLRCGIASGTDCGLQHTGGSTVVPMTVDLTVPGTIDPVTSRPVQRTPLPTEHSGRPPLALVPNAFVIDRPSRLRFLVEGKGLDTLLGYPDSEWSGDVTIIFDAEP